MLQEIIVTASSSINRWKEELKQKRTSVTAQHTQSSAARVLQRQLSDFHYVSSRFPSTACEPKKAMNSCDKTLSQRSLIDIDNSSRYKGKNEPSGPSGRSLSRFL